MHSRFLLSVLFFLLSAGTAAAQDYYGSNFRERAIHRFRSYGDGSSSFRMNYHSAQQRDAETGVKAGIFDLSYTYLFGKSLRNADGSLGVSYVTGDAETGGMDSELEYKADIFGTWRFERDLDLYGSFGAGSLKTGGETGEINDYSIGITFPVRDMSLEGTAGAIYHAGDFSAGKKSVFQGIEVTAFEIPVLYWLKWYVGEIDEEAFVRTDVFFPLHIDQRYGGWALLLGYVNVNSHIVSAGAPPAPAYGLRMDDWTEHEEWWLALSFLGDRGRSPWSGMAAYGYYRAPEIEGKNDTGIISLALGYSF
jgi:hypothetical protein